MSHAILFGVAGFSRGTRRPSQAPPRVRAAVAAATVAVAAAAVIVPLAVQTAGLLAATRRNGWKLLAFAVTAT
jgi:hypothetical protein